MIFGLPLGFAQPLILLGLASLPVLWWLLRLVPPRPRRVFFPPTRLLFDIAPKEETPSRTPWWLTLLRLTLAALVILAAAGPLSAAVVKEAGPGLLPRRTPPVQPDRVSRLDFDDLVAAAATDAQNAGLSPAFPRTRLRRNRRSP